MKKKGFTLIELLAVIVILAIIALIATPVVLNIIEDSKLSAAKDSAMVISKAAETYYMSQTSLEGNEVLEIYLKDDIIKYKGEKPEKGYVTFDSKGNAYLKMYKDGYCIVSDYDNTVVADKMDSKECMLPNEVPAPPLKDGQIVYFNPITNRFCDTYVPSTNSKNGFRGTEANGCMLWHVFLDTEEAETIKLILDHNTSTSTTTWANAKTEIANAKDNNLYGWHAEVYPTARLISALELNQIAPKSGTWNPATSYDYYFHNGTSSLYSGAKGTNKYAWLFDNTEWCDDYGCSINQDGQKGYWTSTEKNSTTSWTVYYYGNLYTRTATNSSYHGVRPVIELPKSKFKDEEWEPLTYTVTFKDGENVVGTKTVTYKTLYGSFPILEKEGYELVWKLNGTPVGEHTVVTVTGDHVIESYWREPTYLAKLYFNPVTNNACRETDYNTTNSISGFRGTADNGCMLWYAYKEDGDNYLMIADHNTSTGNKSWDDANIEIENAKSNNLYGWHADVRSTIKMISAEEVNAIAPYEREWTTSDAWYNLHTGERGTETLGKSGSKVAWLFDNLKGCIENGCNVESGSQDAYWTSSRETTFDDDIILDSPDGYEPDPSSWMVDYRGLLWSSSTSEGVRPVISVPKSKFTN